MASLNRDAAAAALRHEVRAATDVTGFGLAGHAAAIARESRVSLELRIAELPLLPDALDLALRFQPGGLAANRREFEREIEFRSEPDAARRALLFDPQTSGGLLLPVSVLHVSALLAELPEARAIGRVVDAGPRAIVVV
jgi:selenide,water dikinase